MSKSLMVALTCLVPLVACGPSRDGRTTDDTEETDAGPVETRDAGSDAGTCVKRTCGGLCGSVNDGCGGLLTCPACEDGGTCHAENDLEFCQRHAVDCGEYVDFDNCGNSRRVLSCGRCAGTCGLVTPNVCCVPETDAEICSGQCGVLTRTDRCGAPRQVDCGACAAWTVVPSPTTKKLYELHGSGPNDIWAGGEGGALIHWDGTRWALVSSPTSSNINGLWVGGPLDVWVAGLDKQILHFNGSSWSAVGNPTPAQYYGTFALAGSTLYAFGVAGVVASLSGTAWRQELGVPVVGDYYAAYGTSATDLWAVGPSSIVSHWDGVSWTSPVTGYTATFADVWGSHSRNVLIAGSTSSTTGILLRWDGTQFLETTAYGALQGIWGANGFDVYAVGLGGVVQHWDGEAWTQQESGTTTRLNAVWGASGAEVWAVGNGGTILRRKR